MIRGEQGEILLPVYVSGISNTDFFRPTRLLGRGGIGRVYEAVMNPNEDNRIVVLKQGRAYVNNENKPTDEMSQLILSQIHDEYLILRELNTYGVGPTVIGYSESRLPTENNFMIISLAMNPAGESLWDILSKMNTRMDDKRIVTIARQALISLSIAHRKMNIVHRDMKPANVLDDNGKISVIDWGGAGKRHEIRHYSEFERGFGTPAYFAPEQFEEDTDIDFPTDVYGAAATFATMFMHTSRERFFQRHLGISEDDWYTEDSEYYELLKQQIHGYITSDRYINDMRQDLQDANVEEKYITWLMKAFHVDPKERYADAQVMFDELQRIQGIRR